MCGKQSAVFGRLLMQQSSVNQAISSMTYDKEDDYDDDSYVNYICKLIQLRCPLQ